MSNENVPSIDCSGPMNLFLPVDRQTSWSRSENEAPEAANGESKTDITVLIGSVIEGDSGPIPTITRAFIEGLSSKYRFVPHYANRKYGLRRNARFNVINIYYCLKHLVLWMLNLFRYKPMLAHYPVTSYWNFEKSILFLRCARWCGARSIGHLHDGAFVEFWTRLPEWRKRLSAGGLRGLGALIVLSDGWKERVTTLLPIPDEKIFVVNNPIDREFEASMLQLPIHRDRNRILWLSVMRRQKGVLDIIEAAKMSIAEAALDLTIAGPEREPGIEKSCRDLIKQLGLERHITMAGSAWGEKKKLLFSESSIFLFPSYVESFPLVILEAAAAGMAIITTPVGAIPEFFTDGISVVFVKPGNIRQISNAIIDLSRQIEKREALGAQAREVFVNRLSRDRILASLDCCYRQVAGIGSGG